MLLSNNARLLPDDSVHDDPAEEEGAHQLVLDHPEPVLQAAVRLQDAVTAKQLVSVKVTFIINKHNFNPVNERE